MVQRYRRALVVVLSGVVLALAASSTPSKATPIALTTSGASGGLAPISGKLVVFRDGSEVRIYDVGSGMSQTLLNSTPPLSPLSIDGNLILLRVGNALRTLDASSGVLSDVLVSDAPGGLDIDGQGRLYGVGDAKLKSVTAGRKRFTSRAWLLRFFEQLAGGKRRA